MDGVALIREARGAGLRIRVQGGKLSIKGPARAEPLALQLTERKPEVIALLGLGALLRRVEARDRKTAAESWFRELRACRGRLDACGTAILEYARSRWGSGADGWPTSMLAGFYARDLLAGLEGGLGSWIGWEPICAALDSGEGPRIIAELWEVYRDLPNDLRDRVRQSGDRSQSPPESQGGAV